MYKYGDKKYACMLHNLEKCVNKETTEEFLRCVESYMDRRAIEH